jgi:hypothetical protein
MAEGYLPEYMDFNLASRTRWVERRPVKDLFGWLGRFGWFRRSRSKPITAYRCPSCGYLEFYAR